MNEYEEIAKALGDLISYENTFNQILVLAVEYESKNITSDRFSKRVCEILAKNIKERKSLNE